MVLIVYYDLMSQPCRALVMFLKHEGIPFESKVLALRKGENRQPEYLAVNPRGKVPAIQDTERGLTLTESVAIFKYICDQYDVNDHWYPKNLCLRSKVDEYCAWQHMEARYKSVRVFANEVLVPGIFENHGDIVGEMHSMLNEMESFFLKDRPFLTGSEISVADLLAACELQQVTTTGRDSLATHPKLNEWMERVRTTMNPHFDEIHSIVYKVRDRQMKKKGKL